MARKKKRRTYTIACQQCDTSAKPYRGCSRCGGFGIVLEKRYCGSCDLPYWDHVRRGFTVSDGKSITTFDGVIVTFFINKQSVCSRCPQVAR